MAIREKGSLVNPCSFMNTPLVFNHCLYAYGNDIYIHRYNIPEQKWAVIPKSIVWEYKLLLTKILIRAFETHKFKSCIDYKIYGKLQ